MLHLLLSLITLAPATLAAEPVEDLPDGEGTPILLSGFTTTDDQSKDFAGKLERILGLVIKSEDELSLVAIDDVTGFGKSTARAFRDACPVQGRLGCLYTIGSKTTAKYLVGGSVRVSPTETVVDLVVLDLSTHEVLINGPYSTTAGGEKGLLERLLRLVDSIVTGKVRPEPIPDDKPRTQLTREVEVSEAVKRALDDVGSADELISREGPTLSRATAEQAGITPLSEEASGVWEGLGFSDGDWKDYQTSGLTLDEWFSRKPGHSGQIILRAMAGLGYTPSDASWYHRYSFDSAGALVDAYTTQVMQDGLAPTVGGEVAVGVLDVLDVGVGGGFMPGVVRTDYASEGDITGDSDQTTLAGGVVWVGPRVELVLAPTRWLHPALGAGLTFVKTPSIEDYTAKVPSAADLPEPWLGYVSVWPGAQVRLTKGVDFIARVPVEMHILGDAAPELRSTTTEVITPAPPTESAFLSVSGMVGVQLRLLGTKPKEIPEILLIRESSLE